MSYNRAIDDAAYTALLQEVGSNPDLLPLVERLTFAKEGSPEKRAVQRLLCRVVEGNYPIGLRPHTILQLLMLERGVKQADLVDAVGTLAQVSLIVTGKGGITKGKAQALGDYFGVSPTLFL